MSEIHIMSGHQADAVADEVNRLRAEVERLRRQLAPFKERYDKYVKLAEMQGKTLDEVIKMKEDIDAESLRVSMTDPDLAERKFWLECDMAAHFELMCVKLIHEASDDRQNHQGA